MGTHPDLTVTRCCSGEKELVCLGHILDSEHPERTNDCILSAILERTNSFTDLEQALKPCGGRWLLFSRLSGEERLYPDAAGTRSSFYTERDPNQKPWIGAQPAVLADILNLDPEPELVRMFTCANHGNSWTGEVTPYSGIRQLLPNHYLDLRSWVAHRFWPNRLLDQIDPDIAAKRIHQCVASIIEASVRRGPTAVPLTGGYDSRALFASAGQRRQSVTFFIITNPDTPYHDVTVPRRLARAFGTEMKIIQAVRATPEFSAAYKRNVAEMLWEPGAVNLPSFNKFFSNQYVVTGGVGEVGRCFYYKNGVLPAKITPQLLAQISEYKDNPIAINAFAKWLAEVPKDHAAYVLDLFYIEHRAGNWLSMLHNGFDMGCEVIPAYNCRNVFETALAVDVEYRQKPYELFRRICEAGAPGSSGIAFNESIYDSALRRMWRCVPWRIRCRYRSWRLQRLRFD